MLVAAAPSLVQFVVVPSLFYTSNWMSTCGLKKLNLVTTPSTVISFFSSKVEAKEWCAEVVVVRQISSADNKKVVIFFMVCSFA
jgi:hypothetical protein